MIVQHNDLFSFLILSIPDRLSEKRALIGFQLECFRECSLVAIVKPRSKAERSRCKIHVLRDKAGVDEVV